ncbi:hypothetical protein [Jiella sp. M17.18]|uniref:hypothetical protein n=1 Tax=Jiella sp. M17.18 TaxID=3234247 RepID=UPI0034DF5F86
MTATWSREITMEPERTAFRFVDVQNDAAQSERGPVRAPASPSVADRSCYLARPRRIALSNGRQLQEACRNKKIEVLHAATEHPIVDGRGRRLEDRISGIDAPKIRRGGKSAGAVRLAAERIVGPGRCRLRPMGEPARVSQGGK